MPVQDLARCHVARQAGFAGFKTLTARLLAFGGALALTVYATQEMIAVVSVSEVSALQWLMVVLFSLTFGWIALAAAAAVTGVFFGGTRRRAAADLLVTERTALVMPICNETPAASFAALQAMAEGLIESEVSGFEIFVLSDTTNPDIYAQETAAFYVLREKLGENLRVWYRHRSENVGRKVGNMHDFVTRWGGSYDFMIVLDADSVMAPETLVTLVREMAADPDLGLLQTVPRLCGGETLFARLQQFAGAIYGPIVGRGIAAWQGNDGNYWGHNAIIRVGAFAAAAGLPVLPGRKPFGGQILSHDFVEAALLRRAGWAVRMLPTLGGSWENSPPSLLDVAARDRRWAQGNIQHLALLGSRGFTWSNRVHMRLGVMSYLASPLWFALIAAGLATTARIASAQLEYFTDEMTLFPLWPRFDSERMIELFILAMVTLLTPKILGVLRALVDREIWRTVNPLRVVLGAVAETVLSALYAPIMMMMQTRQVAEIFLGRDSGWATQSRKRSKTPWATLIRRHWLQMSAGFAVTWALLYLSPPLLAWMAPALAGLVFALPLSLASGSVRVAQVLRFFGLLTVPEEVTLPPVIALRNVCQARMEEHIAGITFEGLIGNELARQRHFAVALPHAAAKRGRPNVILITARAKLADAETVGEALAWLTPPERLAVLSDRELFAALARLTDPRVPNRPAVRSA
jgi:membrane glycosyltransferase